MPIFRPSFMRPLILGAAISLGLAATAGAAQYATLDSEASQVSFAYSQMGVGMEGGFGDIRASEFHFDTDNPESSQVTIEIPLASIDAGYADANDELEKPEWLSLADHPVATFESGSVQAIDEQNYEVTGDLTIKGHTKTVTVPFTFKEDGDTGIFEGDLTFQRTDFGIGEGPWGDVSIVADDIQVKFHIVARP
ncbi:MAG TPA: YceI family protein [Burkholderiaceae bacterium]|nr:YceI family protein [Burkholderiaceae bacterium]